MRKFTEEEINKLKKYWKQLQLLRDDFDFSVKVLEDRMQNNLKIKDLEFVYVNGYCGIGNFETKELLHSNKLEE